MFHVVMCYNIADVEGMALSLRDWKEYEEKVKNGELDIENEL